MQITKNDKILSKLYSDILIGNENRYGNTWCCTSRLPDFNLIDLFSHFRDKKFEICGYESEWKNCVTKSGQQWLDTIENENVFNYLDKSCCRNDWEYSFEYMFASITLLHVSKKKIEVILSLS